MSAPAGTVTFLFTDVEGSTRLWEQSPETMRAALSRHDLLAAGTIESHRGLLIKSRGEGDSLFSVFDNAPDAAHAACALQQAFASEAWPPQAPLRVRMALHTGEADLREKDYYGVTVNRCARLRLLARGGQILLSSFTRSLIHEALPEGAELIDLGLRSLRDLADPEYVYQLTHPNIPLCPPGLTGEELGSHASTRLLTGLDKYEADLAELKAFLTSAQQSARHSVEKTSLFQALSDAHHVGLQDARRVIDGHRRTEAAAPPTDYDFVLEAVLKAHPAPQSVSRLALLRALTVGGGLSLWQAKRIVDDFCRRQAPDLIGYDGGLLKTVASRIHGGKARKE